ncbi:MAG: phosphoglucosamine mutase [Alphaproteobacteria bacterium]|nr:phosphoglucosamine mutase [Alphaproteobacteria bacterium]OJV13851.1 MAG: phosphoglucosamine mutase [Alphaproteobacteria bacterium 33-17]
MNLFGTDGIRGVANFGNLRPDVVMKVAVALSGLLSQKSSRQHAKVVIGKDTRLSGYMIENALTAGFIASGIDVFLLGPVPTPAVAMLTKSMRADVGIMISASHNPYQDNGIKIFGPDGYKISDDLQKEVSRIIENDNWEIYLAGSSDLGKAKRIDDAHGRYIEFLKATLPKRMSLTGMKIVLDAANGAAYSVGPVILSELGADVIAIGDNPNGYNINEKCGSTYPGFLVQKVLENQADIGIALDGDADRVIIVDSKGEIIDGDKILALIAMNWKKNGKLTQNKIVTTVMANKALEDFLNDYGIEVIRTAVGDRYVMQEMHNNNINLGGEQSGHIILSDFAYTGDGLLAALQILSVMVEAGLNSLDISDLFKPYPQILKNVRLCDTNYDSAKISDLVDEITKETGARILVRKSGTEPLIRIMVEAENEELLGSIADKIENAVIS